MKKSLNITGTSDKTYDLDTMEESRRDNSEKELVVQVHEYTADQNPNPDNLRLGQIWLSHQVPKSEVKK